MSAEQTSGGNGSSKTFITFLSTLITQKIMKIASIGQDQYGFLYALVSESLSSVDFQSIDIYNTTISYIPDVSDYEVPMYVYYLLFVLLLIGGMYHFYSIFIAPMGYVSLKITDFERIMYLSNYLHKHPEICKKLKDAEEHQVDGLGTITVPEHGNKVYFNDKRFGHWGYFKFNVDIQKKDMNLELQINANNIYEILEYLDKIADYLASNRDMSVKKYYAKIMRDEKSIYTDVQTITYSGDRKFLLHSFFHPDKQRLWSMLDAIENNSERYRHLGQSPRIGLVLYGPPGTGKSTFVYRVAMALNRHIVSINLADIKTPRKLFSSIKSPVVNGKSMTHKDVVFIFDELDYSLRELKKMQQAEQKEFMNKACGVGGEDDGEVISEKASSLINSMSMEVGTLITPKDLLELFQGAVPLEGLIIVATTNDLAEIQSFCSALVRPGRLTPVHFDYGDRKMLFDMCKFYFKQELKIGVPEKFTFQQSELIEIVTQCMLMHSDVKLSYNEFEGYILGLVSKFHSKNETQERKQNVELNESITTPAVTEDVSILARMPVPSPSPIFGKSPQKDIEDIEMMSKVMSDNESDMELSE